MVRVGLTWKSSNFDQYCYVNIKGKKPVEGLGLGLGLGFLVRVVFA